MLRLLGKDKTPLGLLVNCKDICIESDLKTGLKNLSFSYPITDELANKIQGECYIQTADYEFVVKEVNKESNDWFSVFAKPNIETLSGKPHLHFEGLESKAADIIRLALGTDTGWTVQEVDTITKRRTIRKETGSTLDIINDVAKVFMIEIEFDTLNKKIKIYNKRGADKGAFFINSLNLKKLSQQANTYDFITRLVPIGKNNLRITAANNGKEYIDNFQYSNKVIAQYWVDKRYTDVNSLLEDARAKLDELSKPVISYSADVLTFNTPIALGDTITLIDNIKEIREVQRVVKFKEYPLTPEKNTIEIANRTLSFAEQQAALDEAAQIVGDITTDSGTIDGSKIEGLPEVDATIPDGSITADKLAANSVSADKIVAGAITADKISAGAITAAKIEAGTIKANSAIIAEGAIGTAQIAKAAITSAQIADGSIDNAKIDIGAINTAQIQDAAIGTAQIADAAITNAKIGSLAVDTANIKDAAITNAKIKNLNAEKITAGDISADRIKTNVISAVNASIGTATIDSAKIGNLSADKITSGDIATDRLKANAINAVNATVGNATINAAKIGNLSADKITTGDLSADRIKTNVIKAINTTTDTAVIGSAKIANLDASKITTGTLNADRIGAETIDASKISADAVSAIAVSAGSVVAKDIEAGKIKIGNANIVDGTISGAKISKATITNAQIADATIESAKIKDLNASKINAGTLDASKVSINSADGTLTLANNTLTIKDNQSTPKTRVQVGKDSRGQYGILVMNDKGEAIFDSDKGVLSDKGLSDGIVSESKIVDNSIGSTKLNVDELFVGENGFISKLKAVEIDAANITTGKISSERLDIQGLVSFDSFDESIKDVFDVSGNKTYINGGMIAANSIKADKIDLLSGITVQGPDGTNTFAIGDDGNVEVNGLLHSGNFDEDKNLGYKISPDGTAILNQAKIKGDITLQSAGMTNFGGQVGNNNLFLNSNFHKDVGLPEITSNIAVYLLKEFEGVISKYNGRLFRILPKSNTTTGDMYAYTNLTATVKPSTTYTISFDCWGAGGFTSSSSYLRLSNGNHIHLNHPVISDKQRRRYEQTFTVPEGITTVQLRFGIVISSYAWMCFDGVKLEEGDSATPWCPHKDEQLNYVRIWAGENFENRDLAPFRVYQNGDVYAANGTFTGLLRGTLDSGDVQIYKNALTVHSPGTETEVIKVAAGQSILNTDVVFGNNNNKRIEYLNENKELNVNVKNTLRNSRGSFEMNYIGGVQDYGTYLVSASHKDGGKHHIKYWEGHGGLIFESDGTNQTVGNEKPYDFKFERAGSNVGVNVKVQGNLEITNSINSDKQNIELRSIPGVGWGFYAT